MIVRAADLPEALPAPLPDTALSPREALGAHYEIALLTAFRTLHAVTGHIAAHLESGGSCEVLMAQIGEFEGLVKAAGAGLCPRCAAA